MRDGSADRHLLRRRSPSSRRRRATRRRTGRRRRRAPASRFRPPGRGGSGARGRGRRGRRPGRSVLAPSSRAQTATSLPTESEATWGSLALWPMTEISAGGSQPPPAGRSALWITLGVASVRDQTATALPFGSSETWGASAESPATERGTAGSQLPPAGLRELWTTSVGLFRRVQTATELPPGRWRTCGSSAFWPAAERSAGGPRRCRRWTRRRPGRCLWLRRTATRPPPRSRPGRAPAAVLRRSARRRRRRAVLLPRPGEPARALHDEPGAVVAGPDGEGISRRVDGHLRFFGVLAGHREVERPLPAAAGRLRRRLDDEVEPVEARPDRDRVAGRVDRQLGFLCGLARGREVDRPLPGAARRPRRRLDDVLGAVVAPPDARSRCRPRRCRRRVPRRRGRPPRGSPREPKLPPACLTAAWTTVWAPSKRVQTATASPDGSTATCGSSASRPEAERSTGASQRGAAWAGEAAKPASTQRDAASAGVWRPSLRKRLSPCRCG